MKKLMLAMALLFIVLFSSFILGNTQEDTGEIFKAGLEYLGQKNYDKALECFDKSIELENSRKPEAYFHRAEVYVHMGRFEDAAKGFLKSCEMGCAYCCEALSFYCEEFEVPGDEWIIGACNYLDPQAGNTYLPTNVMDEKPETAWVVDIDIKDKPFSFDDMIIGFIAKTEITVTGFSIYNGYCKDKETWEKNSRAKRIMVISDSKLLTMITLSDTMEEQSFSFDDGYRISADGHIAFLVLDTYPGTKYTDTAISEIKLIYSTDK
jgi:hypothetical protein